MVSYTTVLLREGLKAKAAHDINGANHVCWTLQGILAADLTLAQIKTLKAVQRLPQQRSDVYSGFLGGVSITPLTCQIMRPRCT